MKDNSSLLDLFIPPEDHFGDFGMLCGFTATRKVLEQIKSKFSGETAKPVLAAFIHPTVNAINDIPGLTWIWMNPDKDARGYALLHAKVALLGFRKVDGKGYIIRLAVCTGNWTEDPMTNSIDLYWSIELNTKNPEQKAGADVLAAWELFEWLRDSKRSDTRLLKRKFDGETPDANLIAKLHELKTVVDQARGKSTRFIDSRSQGLMPQVVERIKSVKRRTKADRLIIGSGFYESGKNLDANKCVPTLVRHSLKSKLSDHASIELVINPSSCQGLAKKDRVNGIAEDLKKMKWQFKLPTSASHGNEAKLHAKFLLLAWGSAKKDACCGQLYLGSGNMTSKGFVNPAGDKGNIEAGVVFEVPDGMTWENNNKSVNSIYRYLPLGVPIKNVGQLESGDDFKRPDEPSVNPPVAYLAWEDGYIKCHEPLEEEIQIISENGQPTKLPCLWKGAPPILVRLSKGDWQIPVIANGVLVRPTLQQLTVEDILARMTRFPASPEMDNEFDPDIENVAYTRVMAHNQTPESLYAIRRVMQLLVALTQTQAMVVPNDWQRWCRELEENLIAISKYEESMIQFFIDAGANPLGVLLDERMRQKGADAKVLQATLERVSKAWFSDKELPCLWAH